MADGTKARSIEELREHADIASIAAYYENGKLYRWLLANYLDDKANKIKSITDSDNAKCMDFKRAVIKDVVQALEIPSISETQISEYRSNDNSAEAKQNIASSCEIEDDAELKAKLKPIVNNNEIDLDDWKICLDESEKENSKAVYIQDKNSGLFVSFDLKNDENFNKAVISLLKNLKKMKSIIDNTQPQYTDLSAFRYESVGGKFVLKGLMDKSLKHVVIPDIFTEIKGGAFSGCSNLESVVIPNSVTTIESETFRNSALENIKIPKSVTWIKDNAFRDCHNLKSVEIPDSVEQIGRYAFYGCSALKNIKIPKSVTRIEYAGLRADSLKIAEVPVSTFLETAALFDYTEIVRY